MSGCQRGRTPHGSSGPSPSKSFAFDSTNLGAEVGWRAPGPPASHRHLARLLVALLLGLAGQAHLKLVNSLGERGQLFAKDRRRRQLLVG